MADTEEKKYLVNIESNLDEYAKKADEARKRVEELTIENLKLQSSETASNEEREKSSASLRVAQQEYRNAKKQLDQATLANKANKNSYEELYRQWQLAQTQLKLLGGAYELNEKGVRVLSQRYIEQSKVVANAKASLDAFGKGVHDNRLNVGSYSEAIQGAIGQFQMIPGPIGQASMAFSRFSKVILANPIVLAITAIIGAFTALFKAFKSTDKGATEFAARFEQIKAIIDVVRQRLIAVTEAIGHVFRGEWKEAGQSMKEAFTGIGEQIKEATKAAYEYQKQLDSIEDTQNNFISRSAEIRNRIARLEFTAQDRTKSVDERRKALEEAIRLGEEELRVNKSIAKQKLEAEAEYLAGKSGLRKEDVINFIRMTDAEQAAASDDLKALRNNNEEKFKDIETFYANWLDLDTRFFEEQRRNLSRLSSFIIQEQKAILDEMKTIQKARYDELLKPFIEELNKKIAAVKNYTFTELRLNKELAAKNADLTEKAVALSNWEIEQERKNTELKKQLAVDSLNILSDVVGRQTAMGKAFAVAAATIDTYAAAGKALNDPTIPSTFLRIAMMAVVILKGLANVRQILAVDTSGKSASSPRASAPSAITQMPALQRSFSQPVGATIFTQPQLTQAQLNALPNESTLTAQDIADAVSRIPAPIVTVEDINAKVVSKQKVEVRANI